MESQFLENRRYEQSVRVDPVSSLHWGSVFNKTSSDIVGRTYCTRHRLPNDKLNNTNTVRVNLYSDFTLTGVKVAVSFSSTSRNTVIPDNANWVIQTVNIPASTGHIVFSNVPVVGLSSGLPGLCLDVWVYAPSGSGFTAMDVSGLNSDDPLRDNEIFCAWTPGDAIAAWPSLGAFVVGMGCPAGVDYMPA